jgi:endo-beta-N-acetylglucosaminidase D
VITKKQGNREDNCLRKQAVVLNSEMKNCGTNNNTISKKAKIFCESLHNSNKLRELI